jgi:hypothetical protein
MLMSLIVTLAHTAERVLLQLPPAWHPHRTVCHLTIDTSTWVSPRTRGTVERSTRPQYSRVPRTSTTAGVCRSRRGEATRWRFVATGAGPSASLPEPPVAMSMPTCAGTLEHGGLTAWQGNIPGGPSSLGSTQAWAGASAAPIQARHHLHPLAIRNPQLGGRPRVLSLKPRAGGTLDEGVSRSYRCDS